MESKELKLWEKGAPDADLFSTVGDLNNEGLPTLTPYLLEGGERRPAMIVCPGGSFQFRAPNEGEPIARWLNQIGFNAFVVNYRVAPFSPFTSSKDGNKRGQARIDFQTMRAWPLLLQRWRSKGEISAN